MKLEQFGVTDAQDMGIVDHPVDDGVQYRLYTSEATWLELYFEPQTGEILDYTR